MAVHNLPAQPTPFVGRHEELASAVAQLDEPSCRLLSLTGPGGIGKTRLALEVATRLQNNFLHGSYFVPLQTATGVDTFVSAITDAAGLSLTGAETPEQQLRNYLRDKELLLLLDNFEQLLKPDGDGEAVRLLCDMLQEAHGVKCLVTSREALNVQEEWLHPVGGLSFPASDDRSDLMAFDAVELLVKRAQQVRPNFSLDEERPGVVRICQLVEGMPLALELAASWIKTLRCAEIVAEIQSNLDFLATSMRNVSERHRSMHAVFDYSWTHLTPEEQDVFQQLSVFQGSFTRQAAQAITDVSLAILSALVDKCMLQLAANGRYHIHELLRQYGAKQLADSAEAARRIHDRHCTYYAGFLRGHLAGLNGPGQKEATSQMAVELENVRAAWAWAISQSKREEIHRCAIAFYYFCQIQSRFLEGANALAEAATALKQMEASAIRDVTLAEVLSAQAWLCVRIGDFAQAKIAAEESRALYTQRNASPPSLMGADPATALATVAVIGGEHDRAVELGEEALQAVESSNDKHNLAFAHYVLIAARAAQGHYDAAYHHAQRAYELARAVGIRWFQAYTLNEWGKVSRAMGRHAEASKHFQASYAIKQEFNDTEGMAVALNHLGDIALLQSEFDEGERLYRQSMALYRDINDRGGLAASHKGLAVIACHNENYATAHSHFRQALQIAIEIQFLPLLFSILIDIGELWMSTGAHGQGLELFALVRNHSASSQEIKERAQQHLDYYQEEFSADLYASGVQRGSVQDLHSVVAALESELAAPAHSNTPIADRTRSEDVAPEQPLPDPLTERELEILQHLAAGHTNRQIAEELVLALGTVKWYTNQIYAKLDVHNRTRAVNHARQLGILS